MNTASPARHARSFLFVPATKPERIAKALDSGADCIIIDLEDAVAEGSKDIAREQLAQSLPQLSAAQRVRTVVRINATGMPWHAADMALLRDWAGQGVAVMLPKSEDPAALNAVAQALGAGAQIVALVESLAGLDALDLIARVPQVVRLAFGHLDFQLDLGMRASAEEPELAFGRNAIVTASRRARHPAQVAGVNAALGYSEAEQAWALRVLEGAAQRGGEVFSLDGRIVDLPVIRAAEAIAASIQK